MAYSIGFDIFARDRASEKFDKVGRAADRVDQKMSRFKAAAAAGLAIVGAAAVKFAGDSISAYTDAAKSQRKLEDAYARFPRLADVQIAKLREIGDAIQEKTRFDGDDVAASQAVLAQYKLTGSQIAQMTPLLADYAAKTGRDIPAAAAVLGKAMMGKGKALADVGIKYKDAGSTAGNFDQVLKGLRENVGGFAEQEGKEAAGKAAILANKFGDLQEKVGAKLLPAVESLTEAGSRMLDWLEENPGKVKAMTVGVAALTAALVVGKVAVLGHAFATGVAAAGGLGKFLLATRAGAAAQWLLNAAMSANPIGLVITALAALAVGLKYAWDNSETFRRVVTTAFGAVKAAALWLWESGIKPMVKFILAGFSWLTSGIASFLDALANVPGFGWAADAAKKMREAARAADDFATGLDSLPNDVSININVRARWSDQAKKAAGLVNTNTQLAIDGFRASGGPVRKGGAYVVGEQGPELLVADEAGQVIDAGRTRQILSGGGPVPVSGGGWVVVNIFGALDPIGTARAVEDALVRLRRTNGGAPLAFMQ